MMNQSPEIITELLVDDGTFPNNGKLPLLVYKNALFIPADNPAGAVEKVFRDNGWGGLWRNGIYPYHHYHSTAHEVLGMYAGTVTVQLGGPDGLIWVAQKGDVIIIPGGVAHKNLGASDDFRCVGAYPPGQHWDMNFGKKGERPGADQNILKIPLPASDPVYGKEGALMKSWKVNPN